MTKTEYNYLYDSLCYGHDAELSINGNKIFVEWNGEKIEIYHCINDEGQKIGEVSGGDRFCTVKILFETFIFKKTLNINYEEIDIVDIE